MDDFWKSDDWSMSDQPTASSGGSVLAVVFAGQLAAAKSLLGAAQGIAPDLGASVVAALLGGDEAAADELLKAGAAQVWIVDVAASGPLDDAAAALTALAQQESAAVVLFASGERGDSLAGQVAGRLGAGLIVGAQSLSVDYGSQQVQAVQPIYGGAGLASWQVKGKPAIFTLRPGTAAPNLNHHAAGKVARFDYAATGELLKVVRREHSPLQQEMLRAKVIVAGGYGVGAAGFVALGDLAASLGAVVGASKSAVAAGWATREQQIGMLGQSVRPDLYIAVGISGTPEHLMGIAEGATIVAINSDPRAPIFQLADYAIVGDAASLLPALTTRLKKLYASN